VTLAEADDPAAALDRACASAAPAVGVWTHLAGVFDAAAGQVRLYVDGAQAASAPATHAWAASGAFSIGRGLGADPFVGDVADVRAWQQAMDQAGLAALASAPPAAHRWDFDDSTSNSAADSSGVSPANTLTTSGGAVVGSGGHRGGGLIVDGTSGFAQTGPVIRTDQSFTVSGWIYLSDKSTFRDLIFQVGSSAGQFGLWYDPGSDRWAMLMFVSDTPGASTVAAVSTASPTLQRWTHLAGVYDAGGQRLLLYVDGALQGTVTGVTGWPSRGPVNVGSHAAGGVDDVRVYRGVLSAAQIARLAAA
jgi:Concanavalin A-like lectin/glucanases superfamily